MRNYGYVVRNIRAQYKVPNYIQDLPTIREWLSKMGCTQYMVKVFENAYNNMKQYEDRRKGTPNGTGV